MKPIIKIENLSKQYRLGTIGTGTLSHDLKRWWTVNMRGQEDPYLKIGETNDRATKGSSEYVWALKDINLEVMPGEILGIIGKNGAGKSTLLKILSKVTGPTTGAIHYNGRIGSLLEVGTGFHSELTGRENVFLNGAILGMTKSEIRGKLDEIIDFSGCERYIDTPVKRYSSGMMVRLGFAVAAHLEPEILVVDEVLAVGDAEFQKKAIGKMQDVSRNDGRTVLFVSHNLASLQQLCQKGIILSNGNMTFVGTAIEAIDQYLNMTGHTSNYLKFGYLDLDKTREKVLKAKIFKKIRLLDNLNTPRQTFPMLSSIKVEIVLDKTDNFPGMDYGIEIIASTGQHITSYTTWMLLKNRIERPSRIILEIPQIVFAPGKYHLALSVTHHSAGIWIDRIENAINFYIEAIDVFNTGKAFEAEYGMILPAGNLILT